MEQKRLCPYCMGELPPAADSCVHCGRVFAGRNPAGCLPVGTVLAGRYTVGEMLSLDGEGILYRGVENLGCFRVTIKEYLPVTLSAERGADCILQPKTLPTCTGRWSASPRPPGWKPCWTWWRPTTPCMR